MNGGRLVVCLDGLPPRRCISRSGALYSGVIGCFCGEAVGEKEVQMIPLVSPSELSELEECFDLFVIGSTICSFFEVSFSPLIFTLSQTANWTIELPTFSWRKIRAPLYSPGLEPNMQSFVFSSAGWIVGG